MIYLNFLLRICLYFILWYFEHKTEKFYKIGITSISVKERYRKKDYMPYNYTIIKEIVSEDLNYIWELESKIKNNNKTNRYKPLISFPGSKFECFSTEPLVWS